MDSRALVTTIVPTFRRPQLLRRAVFSVLNQSYGDFVVRILDNASGDETEDAARELMRLDERVQYYQHPTNIGGLRNMTYGMERVTTPYFNILCDDDLLMPAFLETAVCIHEEAPTPPAFVAARVVIVDRNGRIEQRYPHPDRRLTFAAPDGVVQCLTSGMSMPGVVYRTNTMAAVGPPRTSWWNWTESGWTALAALRHPIELTPEVGAIVFVHPGSASKQMDGADFRVSWFEMLAELRAEAGRTDLSGEWWKQRVGPLAYSRFYGTVARLCTWQGSQRYRTLGALATACGLNAFAVRGGLAVARAARVLGIGDLLNGAFDAVRARRDARSVATENATDDRGLRAAASVFHALNRQAGIG